MMRKPEHCKQKWLAMAPTEGGRICSQCQKTIIDFTAKNWSEITALQQQNGKSLCGMYTDRQLKYWGQEPPQKSLSLGTAFTVSSLLLGITQALPSTARAQNAAHYEATSKEVLQTKTVAKAIIASSELIITGTIRAETPENTFEPLAGASIRLMNYSIGTTSDKDGNYRLLIQDIPIDQLQMEFLTISFVGYETQHISLADLPAGESTCPVQLRFSEET